MMARMRGRVAMAAALLSDCGGEDGLDQTEDAETVAGTVTRRFAVADDTGDLLDHPLVRIRAGDVADLDTVTGVELVGSVLESGGERPLDAHRRLGAGDLELLPFEGLERALDT